ncbi:hypothetical protein BY458DRAFT_497385 [Sporodiniella umbellata]|nr:hypothetical protein BY458DRAFT_497385 [Sporodiniella umbellata]
MSSCIVAGYTVSKTMPFNMSLEETIASSEKASSLLVDMLEMIEPRQAKSNETVQEIYEQCFNCKDLLSEHLWSVNDGDSITSVQTALDNVILAISKYEMMNDIADDEWEFIDGSTCVSTY